MNAEEQMDRRYLLIKIGEIKGFFVTDLHLGFEAEWGHKGLDISQPDWSIKIIDSLRYDIITTGATHVFILGDLEHTFRHYNKRTKKQREEVWVSNDYTKEKLLEYFVEQILTIPNVDFNLIRGNQDVFFYEKLGSKVKVYPGSGVRLFSEQLGLFHGNVRPDKKILQAKNVIFGHVHPAVLLVDKLGFKHKLPVFAKLKLSTKELMNFFYSEERVLAIEDNEVKITILPAYNRHLGGFPLNEKQEGKRSFPMLGKIITHPNLELHLTDGIYLGHLADL